MSSVITKRFVVHGRVQGVFFRATARDWAKRLNVVGYAKNESNGTVEIWAQGHESALKQFQQQTSQGPRLATVSKVEVYSIDEIANHLLGFSIY